jgi:hypothetical protein
MHFVIYARILANTAFKGCAYDFTDKLDGHPTFAAFKHLLECLWGGVRTYLCNDSIKIMIALRYPHETANLANTVALSTNNCDAGCNAR